MKHCVVTSLSLLDVGAIIKSTESQNDIIYVRNEMTTSPAMVKTDSTLLDIKHDFG